MAYSVCKSGPNTFTAIWASVPDSMASMRWDIGCPISMFAPGMVDSFSLTSLATAPRVRPLSSIYGASISETLEPSACSSSSARPVLRATVLTSGTSRMSSSARRPMRSLSSRDMPGNALTLIVNDPSLNDGRKPRPRVNSTIVASIKIIPVAPSTMRVWPRAQFSDRL